ncbi:MAG TPA: hypothetical protein VGF20_02005 [Candidatus Acidoferrum sp.]
MTVLNLVLFLHLAGAMALFIGYGIEWTASALFRNAASVEQLRAWLRVFKVSPPLAGAGLGVILLSGGYLASLSGAMKQGWIPATLVGIFVALALGFALILPRMKRIRTALPAGNEPFSSTLRSAITDPILLTAIRTRFMLATGIVYVMAAKPSFATSLVALAVAVVLGVIFSVSAWNRSPSPPANS